MYAVKKRDEEQQTSDMLFLMVVLIAVAVLGMYVWTSYADYSNCVDRWQVTGRDADLVCGHHLPW
jgi:Tfp pilus assembly protein PilE